MTGDTYLDTVTFSNDKLTFTWNEGSNKQPVTIDLSELKERDIVQGLQHSQMWHRVMNKIQFAACPVVAVLHGAVVGGGLEIASACHI